MERKDTSRNIPFTVGDKYQMWKHIMKEVKLNRFAGPYEKIPFHHYVQSPIGLVPIAGGKTRLIAGSLESANSSIQAARRHFKEVVGKKIRILL